MSLALQNTYRYLPPTILLGFAVTAFAGATFPLAFQSLPFAASVFFIGMTHGAVDLFVGKRVAGGTFGKQFSRVSFGYLLLMLVAVIGLVFAPVVVLAIFALATVHHFGEADSQFRRSPQFSARRSQLIDQLWIVARGSVILSLPLWLWSANSAAIVNDVLALVGSQTVIAADPLYQLGLLGFVLAIVIQNVVVFRDGIDASELFETTCLIAALSLLPPLLSLGLYFLFWHSTRHLYELSTSLETRRQTTVVDHLRSLASLQIKALPLLLPTWATVLFAYLGLANEFTVYQFALIGLLAYIVLTLPHDILVHRFFVQLPTLRQGATS